MRVEWEGHVTGRAADRSAVMFFVTGRAFGHEGLPGVGPVLAARIAAHRDEHGPFAAVEDLLDVSGIGERKLEGLRDSVVLP